MIKLSNVADTRVHTSIVINHPAQSGSSYVRYTINHNLGKVADYTQLFFLGSDADPYRMYNDLYVHPAASDSLGFVTREQTKDSIQIDVSRIAASTKGIYFKTIVFGGDHRAN